MHRDVATVQRELPPMDLTGVPLEKAVIDVLAHPTVASKRFLITIGDRAVGGLTHRDQMVGPWQVPVADVAVTLADYRGFKGEAMAMGERTPLASINAPASGRMAVAEAITNMRSEEHTSELQSQSNLVCRLLLEKKKPPYDASPRRWS